MNGWSSYWLGWFVTAFAAFLIPELWALFTGHSENTLSAQIWRLEQLKAGQHVWQWTAAHWLIGGILDRGLLDLDDRVDQLASRQGMPQQQRPSTPTSLYDRRPEET